MTLLVTYVLVALVFSFLCSVAEAVLLSVTTSYIIAMEKRGGRAGKLLRSFKQDIDRPLTAILSLNTIAHTVGAVGAGAQAAIVFGSAYVGLISAILTLLILFLSEILPKTIGVTFWRELAPAVARMVRVFMWILYPLVFLANKIPKGRGQEDQVSITREEFATMADLGREEKQLKENEASIFKNLLRFSSTRSQDIMTPRTVIFALPEDMNVAEYIEHHAQSPFSRVPLYEGNLDGCRGFVLQTELLLAHAKGDHHMPLGAFKRPVSVFPEKKHLFGLFNYMIGRREQMVLLIDEYGGLSGLVTLEDLVETLLGLEIVDEADPAVDMQALARKQWAVRAARMGLEVNKVSNSRE